MTSHAHKTAVSAGVTQNCGFALITSLIFLLVLTIIGVTMYGRVTRQQHMAGNIQQKVMALSAANYASQSARYLLREASSSPLPSDCANLIAPPTMVCKDDLATNPVADTTWASTDNGIQKLDSTNFLGTVASHGGTEWAYADYPQFYIEYLRPAPPPPGGCVTTKCSKRVVYRITAWGVGGSNAAVAVTRMLYVH